ncbi:hypothetical protein TWF281_011346 [Arthrobotrys megalospora]
MTLSTLPADIIYEICDHLPNQDFLNLQLVCTTITSKLPRFRLDQIFSQRTIFFTDIETARLKRLASTPSEYLARIKHLVFDLSNPYVILLRFASFATEVFKYNKSAQTKLLKYCPIFRDRNAITLKGFEHKFTKAAYEAWARDKYQTTTEIPSWGEDADCTEYARQCFQDFFSMLTAGFKSPITPVPIEFDKSAFLETLIEALKLLPNLQVLEFTYKFSPDKPEGIHNKIPLSWQRYNPSLKDLVAKNPELEEFPCRGWFTYDHDPIQYELAYPAILFCAAQARCRISEIKANRFTPTGVVGAGVYLSRFNSFPLPPSFPGIDQHEATYVEGYNYTFANLTRLEIWTRQFEEFSLNTKISSSLFLATIQNVQELRVRRSLRYLRASSLILPPTLRFPKLRRLEIIRSDILLKPLAIFLETNKESLKELICAASIAETSDKNQIIEYLTNIRKFLDLEVCRFDFLTGVSPTRQHCYVIVETEGRWGEDDEAGGCKYRIRSDCMLAKTRVTLRPQFRGYWLETQSWEGFKRGIRGLEPLEGCADHWKSHPFSPAF